MNRTKQYLLTLALVLMYFYSSAQQLHYTPREVEMIHDSIGKSRWDIGGRLSQYSFRYMSEFFPVGIINKSSRPYQFPYKPQQSFDNIVIRSKKDSLSLEQYLKKLHIAGFIVLHKGAVVYEKYFSMLPEDQHTLQSVTKVITATLITSLVNEKKIDLHQSIDHYIPELSNSDWKGISVKDILNMRSGMDIRSVDFETGPFTNPQHKNYQLESALGVLLKADNTPSSVYKYLAQLKRDTLPGLEAAYSNINTFVLAWLAEKITNRKYWDLVSEKIWQPMGASSNAYTCLSEKGIAWPHGGMSATLRDLARFGMMYTHSEIKARKESLISFKQLQEIFETKPISSPFGPFKWAYQWDMASDNVLIKTGFGGQALYIDPAKETVVAYFNYVDKDWGMNLISEAALNEIMKAANMSRL